MVGICFKWGKHRVVQAVAGFDVQMLDAAGMQFQSMGGGVVDEAAAPGAGSPGFEVGGAAGDDAGLVEVDHIDGKAHEQAVYAGAAGDEQPLIRLERFAQHESAKPAEKGVGKLEVERVHTAGGMQVGQALWRVLRVHFL